MSTKEKLLCNGETKCYGICSYDSNSMKSSNPHSGIYEAETTRTLDNNGGNPACNQGGMVVVCYDRFNERQNGEPKKTGEIAPTITEACGTSGNNTPIITTLETQPILLESNQNHATVQTDGISTALPASMGMGGGYVPMVCIEGNGQRDSHKGDEYKESDVMYTLNTVEQHAIAVESHAQAARYNVGKINQPLSANMEHDSANGGLVMAIENHPNDSRVQISKDNKVQTLSGRMGTGGGNTPMALEQRDMIVRRLTPLECERLQGFPDGWTDIGDWVDSKGKLHKGDADSPRYKALGNSIALPFWQWMAERMVKYIDSDEPTMASLFDGIGGFPLVYSRVGVEPVWASEIEEFPIAVTKKRIGEN